MTRPRELTPLGKLLAARGITARGLGEALGIAEGRERRVPTEHVNNWVHGHKTPTLRRQKLIAELLKMPPEDLFVRKPKRPRNPAGAADLELAATAERLAPDKAAAERHLADLVAQEQLPDNVTDAASRFTRNVDYRALQLDINDHTALRKAA